MSTSFQRHVNSYVIDVRSIVVTLGVGRHCNGDKSNNCHDSDDNDDSGRDDVFVLVVCRRGRTARLAAAFRACTSDTCSSEIF